MSWCRHVHCTVDGRLNKYQIALNSNLQIPSAAEISVALPEPQPCEVALYWLGVFREYDWLKNQFCLYWESNPKHSDSAPFISLRQNVPSDRRCTAMHLLTWAKCCDNLFYKHSTVASFAATIQAGLLFKDDTSPNSSSKVSESFAAPTPRHLSRSNRKATTARAMEIVNLYTYILRLAWTKKRQRIDVYPHCVLPVLWPGEPLQVWPA